MQDRGHRPGRPCTGRIRVPEPCPPRKRYRNRDNMEKLKSGDLANVVEVIRNLMRADRVKKLSTGEKKMLSNARQILISEIVLVEGISQEEAEKRIAEAV